MPCEDFTRSPLPGSVNEYNAYVQLAIEFIEARNRRIDAVEPFGVRRSARP